MRQVKLKVSLAGFVYLRRYQKFTFTTSSIQKCLYYCKRNAEWRIYYNKKCICNKSKIKVFRLKLFIQGRIVQRWTLSSEAMLMNKGVKATLKRFSYLWFDVKLGDWIIAALYKQKTKKKARKFSNIKKWLPDYLAHIWHIL